PDRFLDRLVQRDRETDQEQREPHGARRLKHPEMRLPIVRCALHTLRRPMIRFVYFDAGGTLIAPDPSVGAVYARAGAPHGLAASGPAMEDAFRQRWPGYTARR